MITGRQINAITDKGCKTSLKEAGTKGSAEGEITQEEV